MTIEEFIKAMDDASTNGKSWESVQNKRSEYRDLHAMIRLSEIVPRDRKFKFISSAEHEQVWLSVDLEKLAQVATPELVDELEACGVFVEQCDGVLSMFV